MTIIDERIKIAKERQETCNTCDQFVQSTKTCKECGCLMPLKTLFPWANCPLGKWKSYRA